MAVPKKQLARAEGIFEVIAHPHVSDVDLEAVRRLSSDRTLITLQEIGKIFGSPSKQVLYRWLNAAMHYLEGHQRVWPPDIQRLRSKPEPGSPHTTFDRGLPPHPSVLPPPAIMPGTGLSPALWYAGEIYKWGFRTGRLDLTGKPKQETGTRRKTTRTAEFFQRLLPRKVSPE